MAMQLEGTERIAASIQQVWAALNDPEILRLCVPGCESIEQVSPTEMEAVVALKMGPIKAKFNGVIFLTNLNPPHSYRITGEGKGGIAGFAKGGAEVRLEEESSTLTVLTYHAEGNVGGKMAQLGARLITSTSQKLAAEFFANFNKRVSGA